MGNKKWDDGKCVKRAILSKKENLFLLAYTPFSESFGLILSFPNLVCFIGTVWT